MGVERGVGRAEGRAEGRVSLGAPVLFLPGLPRCITRQRAYLFPRGILFPSLASPALQPPLPSARPPPAVGRFRRLFTRQPSGIANVADQEIFATEARSPCKALARCRPGPRLRPRDPPKTP